MTITYDNTANLTEIYRWVNGAFDTTNYGASTAFDLFSDSAVVGDYILFSTGRTSLPWHNIHINIGTALVATNITVVWEYVKQTNTWTAIPNVVDGTNIFQNIGNNTV